MNVQRHLFSLLTSVCIIAVAVVLVPVSSLAQPPQLLNIHLFRPFSGGASPVGNLALGKDGIVYGTTLDSGFSLIGPSVWRAIPPSITGGNWVEESIFVSPDLGLTDGVTLDSQGNLYTGTFLGGETGAGNIFELTAPTTGAGKWTQTILYSFPADALSGAEPVGAPLLFGKSIIGATQSCYELSCRGTIYELYPNSSGEWSIRYLHIFTGGADGASPSGGLIADKKGNLFGTAFYGGIGGNGTVFELSPPETTGDKWSFQVIYSFEESPDGSGSATPLVFGPDGVLYGTTENGGVGYGTVFTLTPQADDVWTEKVIHAFAGGADGSYPLGSVTFGQKGGLYGTTQHGGLSGWGAIYLLMPPTSPGGEWTNEVLASCDTPTTIPGQEPEGGLLLLPNGSFVGTTFEVDLDVVNMAYTGEIFLFVP